MYKILFTIQQNAEKVYGSKEKYNTCSLILYTFNKCSKQPMLSLFTDLYNYKVQVNITDKCKTCCQWYHPEQEHRVLMYYFLTSPEVAHNRSNDPCKNNSQVSHLTKMESK